MKLNFYGLIIDDQITEGLIVGLRRMGEMLASEFPDGAMVTSGVEVEFTTTSTTTTTTTTSTTTPYDFKRKLILLMIRQITKPSVQIIMYHKGIFRACITE